MVNVKTYNNEEMILFKFCGNIFLKIWIFIVVDHPGILKWSPSSQQMIQKWSPSNHQLTKWSPSSNQMIHRLSQSYHEMVTKWSNFKQFFDALQQILEVNSYIYAYHCNVCRDWQSIEWGTINKWINITRMDEI